MWQHSLTVFHIMAVRLDEASRSGYQNNKAVFTINEKHAPYCSDASPALPEYAPPPDHQLFLQVVVCLRDQYFHNKYKTPHTPTHTHLTHTCMQTDTQTHTSPTRAQTHTHTHIALPDSFPTPICLPIDSIAPRLANVLRAK